MSNQKVDKRIAKEEKELQKVQKIFNEGGDVHLNREALLRRSVRNNYVKVVEFLVKVANADVNICNGLPLRTAVMKNSIDMVNLLIDLTEPVNRYRCLFLVKHVDMMFHLLTYVDIELEIFEEKNRSNVLQRHINNGRLEIVEFLINRGFKPSEKHLKVYRYLVDKFPEKPESEEEDEFSEEFMPDVYNEFLDHAVISSDNNEDKISTNLMYFLFKKWYENRFIEKCETSKDQFLREIGIIYNLHISTDGFFTGIKFKKQEQEKEQEVKEENDIYSTFIANNLRVSENIQDKISTTEMYLKFRNWYQSYLGESSLLSEKDFVQIMSSKDRLCQPVIDCWLGITFQE